VKIAVAQLNPKVGDIRGNLAKAMSTLDQVAADQPDLVVFPELFLTGYPPLDLLERSWFVSKQEAALDELTGYSSRWPETGVIIGAALPSRRKPGRGLYNSAVLIYQGRVVFKQPKSLLPTYDVFDEARYFDSAPKTLPVTFKGERLGLNVCEDAWNTADFWPQGRIYDQDPITLLHEAGTTLFINISASPFHAGKDELRYRLIQQHAAKHRTPFVFVNQVGGNDDLIFDGRSMVFDENGRLVLLAPAFEEDVLVVNLGRPQPGLAFRPQDRIESIRMALVLGLRDYVRKSGFSKVVVGLSGGIDSAVTFALAAEALGPENVLGVSMPSPYSSPGSVEDSRKLAENLGVEFKVVSITGIFEAYLQSLGPHFEGLPQDVTEENIQARIRGNLLMGFSNKLGHLVLATGNKSEVAMGYCTLYGDMSGGLSVISDVPKVMVYDLAGHINQDREVIPQAVLDKAPSAELRPDQKDEDSLPPYPVLDQILNLYIEDGRSREEIVAAGFEPDMVHWVVRMVNRNEYKRKQAAPGLKVTSKAFGFGRRMPIVAEYDL